MNEKLFQLISGSMVGFHCALGDLTRCSGFLGRLLFWGGNHAAGSGFSTVSGDESPWVACSRESKARSSLIF